MHTTNDEGNNELLGFFSLLHEIEAVCISIFNGARYGLKIRFPHAFVMTFLFRNDISLRRKVESIIRITFQHMWSLAKFAGIYKTIISLLKYISRRLHDLGYCHHEWNVGHFPSTRRTVTDSTVRYWLLRSLQLFVHGWSSYTTHSSSMSNVANETLPMQQTELSIETSKSLTRLKPPGTPELSHHAFLAGAAGGYLVWGRHFTSLHYQIVMYLASRVMVGCMKLCMTHHQQNEKQRKRRDNNNLKNSIESHSVLLSSTIELIKRFLRQYGYPISATVVWAIVMMLFENYPEVLHPSLKRSMDEIYGVPFSESSVNESK